MEQIKLNSNEALVYIAMLNIALGVLFGAVPLVLGFIRKERSYGVFGFLGSVIGGAILGVFLSVPVAAIFTWLILRRPKNKLTADSSLQSVSKDSGKNTEEHKNTDSSVS